VDAALAEQRRLNGTQTPIPKSQGLPTGPRSLHPLPSKPVSIQAESSPTPEPPAQPNLDEIELQRKAELMARRAAMKSKEEKAARLKAAAAAAAAAAANLQQTASTSGSQAQLQVASAEISTPFPELDTEQSIASLIAELSQQNMNNHAMSTGDVATRSSSGSNDSADGLQTVESPDAMEVDQELQVIDESESSEEAVTRNGQSRNGTAHSISGEESNHDPNSFNPSYYPMDPNFSGALDQSNHPTQQFTNSFAAPFEEPFVPYGLNPLGYFNNAPAQSSAGPPIALAPYHEGSPKRNKRRKGRDRPTAADFVDDDNVEPPTPVPSSWAQTSQSFQESPVLSPAVQLSTAQPRPSSSSGFPSSSTSSATTNNRPATLVNTAVWNQNPLKRKKSFIPDYPRQLVIEFSDDDGDEQEEVVVRKLSPAITPAPPPPKPVEKPDEKTIELERKEREIKRMMDRIKEMERKKSEKAGQRNSATPGVSTPTLPFAQAQPLATSRSSSEKGKEVEVKREEIAIALSSTDIEMGRSSLCLPIFGRLKISYPLQGNTSTHQESVTLSTVSHPGPSTAGSFLSHFIFSIHGTI
jgi:hypothetical protein